MSNPFGIILKTPRYASVYKDFTLRSAWFFCPISAHPVKIDENIFEFECHCPYLLGYTGVKKFFGAPAVTANAPN
jgi:hypothetical protein